MKKNKNINEWLLFQKKRIIFSLKMKKLSELKKWKISSNKIYHESKKFFQIIGIRVKSNYHKNLSWEQPIVRQNEKGILGILRRKNNGIFQYLIQAKMEPGNINKLQLSPTVQATKSNYNRVHSGKKVRYLNFFKNVKKKDILVDVIQSEQGGRYLFKFNKNTIVNINKNIKLEKNYIWLTKRDLSKLIQKNNLLNMDSISVLSCAIKKNTHDFPEYSLRELQDWFNILKRKYFIKRKIIPLNKLKSWQFDKGSFCYKNNKYFSIIGINVKTNSREIPEWDQPIIKEKNLGLSGFIIKKINSTYHYLVRFSLQPGIKRSGLSCTVRTSNIVNCLNNNNYSNLMKYYLKKYFINNYRGIIKYNKIQSDEGGRFFHSRSKNLIVQIGEKEKIKLDPNYIWMSHNQILHFVNRGIFDIEARILFTCFNIKNIL